MKTIIDTHLTSKQDAIQYIKNLSRNGEIYHLDDDAHDQVWNGMETDPTPNECDMLNQRRDECFHLLEDPHSVAVAEGRPSHVQSVELQNTGGGCMVDIYNFMDSHIELNDECVCLYQGVFDPAEEPIEVGLVYYSEHGKDIEFDGHKGEGWFVQSWDKETKDDIIYYDVIRLKNGIIIVIDDVYVTVYPDAFTFASESSIVGLIERP